MDSVNTAKSPVSTKSRTFTPLLRFSFRECTFHPSFHAQIELSTLLKRVWINYNDVILFLSSFPLLSQPMLRFGEED
jgi:hypothetical protein